MLRACVIEYPNSWDKNLLWVEFSYNNNYQKSLKIASFESLYGRQCHTPLNWIESGEKIIFCPDIIDEAKAMVHRIQDNLKAAKSCQESYANQGHWPLEFEGISCVPKGFTNEGRKEVWGEREAITSLHRIIPHSWVLWNRAIQVGVTTVIGRSSQYLPRISAEEMFKDTCGCCITGGGTARGRFDISRASDQDLWSKESGHKAEDDQVF
jgi:hypothetical protein